MTLQGAQESISLAGAFGLSGAEFIATLGDENVMWACNGIGPAWLKPSLREKLNKWFRRFRVCADVHDCRFTFDNDGSDAKFRAANDELERNCLIMANSEYKWYNPLRYLWRHRARVVADTCRLFGWSDWRKAFDAAKAQGIVPCASQFPPSGGNAGGEGKPPAKG